MKILYVEDDLDYASEIKLLLEKQGYDVDYCQNVVQAFKCIKSNEYQLLLTDLRVDGLDGFQLIELIHVLGINCKIVILSSSNEDNDHIRGLELRIDAYINKSSSSNVILKRIEHLYNEPDTFKHRIVSSHKEQLLIDLDAREVMIRKEEVKLSYYEFELLAMFLKNKNHVFTREELLEACWSKTKVDDVNERTIDTHIKVIRSKLGIRSIASIRGVGYKWTA